MNKLTMTLIMIVLIVSLAGCITMEQTNQRVNAWQNVTLSDLINSWGVPTKEQVIAERKYYIWNNASNDSSPTIGLSAGSYGGHGGISIGTLLGGNTEENFCSRVVEVDADDKIQSIKWNGKPKLCYELTPERLNP